MVEHENMPGGYESGNKYERLATQNLNKTILQCHGTESLDIRLPSPLQLTAEHLQELESILQQQEKLSNDWGFKDPRTCLTYPALRPYLPQHVLILVYRHPVQVYLHYRNKATLSKLEKLFMAGKILRSWSLHNRQLLAVFHEQPASCTVINFERLMGETQEWERLAACLQRPLADARKPAQYQRHAQRNKLVSIADAMFRLRGTAGPLSIFKTLEQARLSQIPSE